MWTYDASYQITSVIYVKVHTQENVNKWQKKRKLSTQSHWWHP